MTSIHHRVGAAAIAAFLVGLGIATLASCGGDDPTFPGPGGGGSSGTGSNPCSTVADCPVPSSVCSVPSCEAGVCKATAKPQGTPLPTQPIGDCKKLICDGAGNAVDSADDTDVKSDGKECTTDVCTDGVPSNPQKPAGTACGDGGALACDDHGDCVGCLAPADCGADSECQHPTCTNGICGVDNESRGVHLASQTAGDCHVVQCDGAGHPESVIDATDFVPDTEECTSDACDGGDPVHPPVAANTACDEDPGHLCDGNGACVECIVPSDCPGSDTECQTRQCNAGVCSLSFQPLGTHLASQTAGDCQAHVCDGSGGFTDAADDLDLPNDNNPCTENQCAGGAPQFPPAGAGTTCGAGLFCNDGGQCIGCTDPVQCPGTDGECGARTCVAATCGFAFSPLGTLVAAQTANDCKKNVCDGSGNIVSQNDNGDLPAGDGIDCTGEVCSAGTASHPTQPTNTPCNQNGGSFCSPLGLCVACNAPAQCPGSDTECQSRTCTANACGLDFVAVGTATATQSAGDCKETQCNGSGGTAIVNDDTDTPLNDGNTCTGETCSGGMALHPPQPLDTMCNQSGGSWCDSTGACVECNHDAQCASMSCNTTTHTCNASSCTDGILNGTESAVDCGGACPGCGPGIGCGTNSDCAGGACDPMSSTCAPTCTDATAPGATCTSYCNCMTATCSDKFPSFAACVSACAAFDEPQLCCRAYHCVNAMADAVTHCPHAAGESLCP